MTVAQSLIRQHHVMVIDDDETLGKHVAWHLREEGYRVSLVTDGAQALAEIALAAPDLILLDHYLPDTNGTQLLAALREAEATSLIPVIYLTNDGTHQRFRASMNGGADDFFAKPVDAQELAEAVRAQLRKSYARMISAGELEGIPDKDKIAHLALELQSARGRLERAHDDRRNTQAALRQLEGSIDFRVTEETRRLELENAALKAYGYSLAHELRRPLRGIVGFAGLLMDSEAGKLGDESARMLKRIEASGRSMNEFIEGLLSMATAERQPLLRERVDLSALALDIVDSFASSRGCVQVAPGLATDADPVLLRIVLENLLSNAVKYTSKITGAAIEFNTCEINGETVYFVRDNGVGFDMGDARRLFEPFQRLHSTTDYDGLGIGLATVQQIVARHGGRVWARSATGEGATFFFTLTPAA